MDATALSNTFTCQPQQRNMHGRVFGGFLMRRAYELAFATVHMFAGRRPRFVAVDRVRALIPEKRGLLACTVAVHARVMALQQRTAGVSNGITARRYASIELNVQRANIMKCRGCSIVLSACVAAGRLSQACGRW